MKRAFTVIFCLLLCLLTSGCTKNKQTTKLVPPVLSPCMNIGNSLEAPKGVSWGVPMDVSYFSIIKQAGFRCVRLPVRFSDYIDSDSSGYHLDDSFMQQIDGYVDAALKQNLTLILDLHHFEQIMDAPQANTNGLIAIWKQLAERYKSKPNTLVFEILNEPQGNLDSASWNFILNETVKAIRKIDKRHFLIVGGVEYNSIDSLNTLQLPDDDRLIATVHYYEPNEVTFQGDSYSDANGIHYENLQNIQWNGTAEETAYLKNRLTAAKTWANQHHVPLFLGEFGVKTHAPEATRVKWTAAVVNEADMLGISYGYWEFASDFGVYNLSTHTWNTELLQAILNSGK